MRFNYLKETVKSAVLAMTVLLATAGVTSAQTVNLTSSQQTTTTPDGNTIPMWGWTCGATAAGGSGVASVTIASGGGGAGYAAGTTATFSGGGGGTGATATVTVTAGSITAITVTNPGAGYTSAPTLTLNSTPAPTTAASFTVNLTSVVGVASVTIASGGGGAGYAAGTTATFSGGGGTGATATVTVTAGSITAITVNNPGAGYTSAPTLTLNSTPAPTTTASFTVNLTSAVTPGCTALTYNLTTTPPSLYTQTGPGVWQPPLIVVPYTSTSGGVSTTNLTINLTNNLPVETSIMILGQAGGGLGAVSAAGSGPGTTAGPVREAAPRTDGDHQTQTATTWTIVAGGTFTPPSQSNRTRSMVPEVCPPGITTSPCSGFGSVGGALQTGTYTWLGLKPGTYLMRSATYPSIQGPMGLYGVLVVTQAPTTTAAGIAYPAASGVAGVANAVTYDADVVALESEIDARQNRMVAAMSTVCPAAPAAQPAGCITGAAGSSMVNTGFSEIAKWNAHCGAGVDGLTPAGAAPTCYPPAVDYTPTYFLINGVAFSKDAQQLSALPVPAPSTAAGRGNDLIRFVNAGSHMHTPSVNGLNMLLVAEDANVLPDVAIAISPAVNKTLSANSTPTSTNCTAAGSTIACGLQLRTEVFQAAGKVMDVIVSPGTAAATYQIYDRALEALSTNNSRDGGMQAVLDVADPNAATTTTFTGAGGLNSTGSLGAVPAYTCVPGVTLRISDAGKGVAKNGVNIYGVTLAGNPPNNTIAFGGGTLTLNSDGTFVYIQPSTATTCGGSFSYYATSGSTTLTASATINPATPNNAGVHANPDTYTAQGAALLRVGPPGILANDTDDGGYPLSVLLTSITGGTGITGACSSTVTTNCVYVAADGGFTATVSAAGTYTFTYQAQNSQKAHSSAATVTLIFPTPSSLSVTVQDAPCAATATSATIASCAISDYKWIIEQDLTYTIDPACQVNTGTGARPTGSNGQPCPALPPGSIVPPTPATNFHTSFMPVIAEGCTGPQSCSRGQTVYDAGTPCTSPGVPAGCSATAGQHVAAACDGYGVCTIGATQLPTSMPSSATLTATNPDGTPAHYYISILSGDSQNAFAYANVSDPSVATNCNPVTATNPNGTEATGIKAASSCGHTMGGAPIPVPTTCTANPCTFAPVTVNLQRNPLPTATVTAFVFEDDYPLNGEPDTGGGVDSLATLEKPLADFSIMIWDDAGGVGDFTGQMTYDMFNMPLTNALNGTIDPNTGFDACPIANTGGVAAGAIITCPLYESDGKTPSPLTGQVVVRNLMMGKFSLIAHPGAAREAAGEEWLQTNSLDGGHFLDSFIKPGEPPYFAEFGPGGYHVFFGFANPAHINARLKAICGGATSPAIPFAPPCHNTLKGQVANLHQDRSPSEQLFSGGVFPQGDPRNYAPVNYTNCYAAIGDTDGATIALAKCDPDGNFTFSGLPDGDYGLVLFDQWDDFIVDGSSHQVHFPDPSSGNTINRMYPNFTWQAHLWSRIYMDTTGQGSPNLLPDGSLDPALSPGLIQVPSRIRHTNGKIVNTLLTDIGGNSRFDETFPLFAFYTVESDNTRFRTTGVHIVNDNGGAVDGPSAAGGNGNAAGPYQGILNSQETFSLPAALSVPGAVYCGVGDAACRNTTLLSTGSHTSCGTGGSSSATPCQSTGRIDPGSHDVEGWQGGVSQFNMIDWGKQPYYMNPTTGAAENGGIRGRVVNNTTRNFDDIRMQIQNLWEPLVPRVRINLYQEGFAADGVTPTLTLVDTTTTDSFDDWAQGFNATTGLPNMNCTGQDPTDPFFAYTMAGSRNYLTPGTALPNNSQYKCYDGYHNLNQLQPAPYDGQFRFPSAACLAGPAGSATAPTFTIPGGTAPYNCATIVNPAFGVAGQTGAAPRILPPGKYVTEVVPPLGWQVDKEEDLNLLIGDQYIAPAVSQFTGLGSIFITPDQASIDSANLSYTGPYNASNPYTQPWTCTTPTSCMLTPSTTNNGKQSTDYGRTTFGVFAPGGLQLQSAPCVGRMRIVPDFLSISPESGEVAPFAGSLRPLCDRKEITLSNQMQADLEFNLYTLTPKTTSFTGFISDDFSSEFDPASPAFGEKFAVPNVPVSIRDFNGNEVSRVYSDQWGVFNGLVYSSWEVDPPNITGFSPNMMVTCMNDPGPIPDPNRPGQTMNDPNWNPAYSTFCYENPFMPGDTTYLDTPVVPVSAFAEGYNPPDCAYPDGTPMILSVLGDTFTSGTGTSAVSGRGPWVSAGGHTITINALAPTTLATPIVVNGVPTTAGPGIQVPNHAYSGPAASTAPYNQKFVTRHYGFGPAPAGAGCTGTNPNAACPGVTIGGIPLHGVTWTDATITAAVPSNLPSCPLLQTNASTGAKIPAQCGELVITAANGQQSIDTVTVTVGGGTPRFVGGENAKANAIQAAIDNANPGDLIIVGCAAGQNSCTYNEMLLMWKPLRLQGIGDGAVTVNANVHPAGKLLEPWRRKVNCLFGLALNGGTLRAVGTGNNFDPTGTFTCNSVAEPAAPVDALVGEPILGWDATLNGNLAELLQEPTLMGAYEGAGITLLAKGLENGGTSTCTVENAAACIPLNSSTAPGGDCNINSIFYTGNYLCNPSRVDGLTFTNSSQGGGGVFLHAFNHNTEVSNLNITSNGGTLTGGITVGQMETVDPATATVPGGTIQQALAYNTNVNIHNNRVTSNAAYGDELNSNTPASAGGVTICTGADNYKFQHNWVCGNWSSGDGGGVAHHGFSWNGTITDNWIIFNQSINPSLVTNGGGLVVHGHAPDGTLGEAGTAGDVDVAPTLTPGIGPGLKILNNVFQGNTAEEGQGGGMSLMHINGIDVQNNPTNPGQCGASNGIGEFWYCVTVTNNIFANNVAGWTGGGVSLLDAVLVNFQNNTVVSNDSTATAGVVFNSNGAPLGNVPPPGCNPVDFGCTPGGFTPFTTSSPLPAGLVTEKHSQLLTQAFTSPTVTCPAGHDTSPATHACTTFSIPHLDSDVFWQNRSFSIGTSPTVNARNSVILLPTLSQTSTGGCPTEPAFSSSGGYWDIGTYGDTDPTSHTGSGLTLSPTNSVLSSGGYGGSNSGSVTFTRQYCNGSRVAPEIATLLCTGTGSPTNAPGCIYAGAVGIQTNGGVPDSAVPPNPLFSISPAATIDEGSNWINMFYGPLSLSCMINIGCGSTTTTLFNAPLGNYQSTSPAGAKSFPPGYPNP